MKEMKKIMDELKKSKVVMHTLQSESLKKCILFAKNMNLHQRNITNKLDSIFWAKTKLKQDIENLCKA